MPTSRTSSRTTSRTTSRAAASARTAVLTQLKEDHQRVKKVYRDFQKLDPEEDPQACQALVLQVLDELTEHESVRTLITQLRGRGPDDEKYAARFTVLCEYVMHHVKEEESEMFPQLQSARLDWESLATEMNQRREELAPLQDADTDDSSEDESTQRATTLTSGEFASASGRASRSKSVGSSRRT